MKAIHFEILSYVVYVLMVLAIVTRFENRRDYWYALIGCSLGIPFEWFADKFWMFLDYDLSFTMLVDRLPLMMAAAWGWFFALPLIVCLQLEDRIDRIPLGLRILTLYAIFWFWDVSVEFTSTGFGLWVYHWKKEAMIGGVLPWFIPTMVAPVNVGLYFAHKIALRRSAAEGWLRGLLTHTAAYYAVLIVQAAVGWPLVRLF